MTGDLYVVPVGHRVLVLATADVPRDVPGTVESITRSDTIRPGVTAYVIRQDDGELRPLFRNEFTPVRPTHTPPD